MKAEIPEKVRRQLVKAGKARAAKMTREDRQEYGRKAWQTRIARAAAADALAGKGAA